MRKTSVYLEPDLDSALTQAALALGKSKAELIRESLRRSVAEIEPVRISAISVGRGPGDVSTDTDRHLEESGFGQS